jgi:N-acetylmuramoyl-L-alanine amidase-like protein/flagellar hook capping protein FlgD
VPRTLRIALACLFTFPASAWAGQATIVSQELPIGVSRTTAGAVAPSRFNLVGLHWQGSGKVLFRTHSVTGRWSAWQRAAPEDEDQPDRGTAETRLRVGWRLGNPYWAGSSDRIGWRVIGNVRRLRAWYVWSPVGRRPAARTVSLAGSPKIMPRSGWNANEAIRRHAPRYAKGVYFAIVHHTAGSNSYGPGTSPAIVRGIELYHVRGNGWNDIGYNFLVDKYGQVFEGRAGGVDRNVIGAQAEGFNTGSAGIAVIGNYTTDQITPSTQTALASLLAWRLDVAHVDPLGFVTWTSGGNPKYPRGVPVLLRTISGHRDTGFTSCPGTRLYAKLPDLAHQVASIGLPKLYAPTASGSLGGPVKFTARLSSARPWVVTVKNVAGRPVARGAGTSLAVSWVWNAAGIAPGSYTWTIEAGPGTRPATGTIGRAPMPVPTPPASILTGLTLDPAVLSPDGDGIADMTTISYTLAGRAAVTATIEDSSGAVVATLFSGQLQGAHRQSFPYAADGLPDGRYVLTVSAAGEDERTASLEASFAVDRTLSGLSLTTQLLTPNGDGADDTLGIGFSLAVAANVTVQIEQAGTVVASVFAGQLPSGASQVFWDGTTPSGSAPDGAYEVAVTVDGPFGVTRHATPFTISH